MNRSPGSRRTANLPKSLQQQLNTYAVAASAAGVSLLALVQPSEARILYTKAHRVIGFDSDYKLDLNHDGKADFIIYHNAHVSDSGHASSLSVSAASSALKNEAEGTVGGRSLLAAALERGARIPKNRFSHRALMAYACTAIFCTKYDYNRGKWINVTNRYLGLKFRIHGKTHYGWARLTVQVQYPATIAATLTGYAYETIPNKPIKAGQTHDRDETTLGHLATGASAIPVWRVKPTAATTH
jgi:hypothetical protein